MPRSLPSPRMRSAFAAAALAAVLTLTLVPAGRADATPASGPLLSWGALTNSQLGYDPEIGDGLTPHVVPGLLAVVGASANGASHALAVLADGTVRAWGLPTSGAIGNGVTATRPFQVEPFAVPGVTGAVAVAAGTSFSLALLADGRIKAWGANAYGQLGDGTTTVRTEPVDVVGITDAVAIAAAATNGIALLRDGTVKTWGFSTGAGLGTLPGNVLVPETVPGIAGAVQVAAAQNQVHVLQSDGVIKTWGTNLAGQLGDGTKTNRTTPVPVDTAAVTGKVVAISDGQNHGLALTDAGHVYGWGDNARVGAVLNTGGDDWREKVVSPIALPITDAVEIVAARDVSLVRRADGTVWSWGGGLYLGDGTSTGGRYVTAAARVRTTLPPVGRLSQGGYANVLFAIRTLPQTDVGALDFGDQAQGTLGTPRSVAVNAVGVPLEVTGVRVLGDDATDFLVAADDCREEIVAADGSCAVSVRFSPTASGARNATLVVRTAQGDVLRVALTGTGGTFVEGPRGADGTPGAGTDGPQGPQGPVGPQGSQGAPGSGTATPPLSQLAVGNALVCTTTKRAGTYTCILSARSAKAKAPSCRAVGSARKTVRCTATRVGGRTISGRAKATLLRNGRAYAAGTVSKLTRKRTLVRGRYTLRITLDRTRTAFVPIVLK